jgi:hypothetical protein
MPAKSDLLRTSTFIAVAHFGCGRSEGLQSALGVDRHERPIAAVRCIGRRRRATLVMRTFRLQHCGKLNRAMQRTPVASVATKVRYADYRFVLSQVKLEVSGRPFHTMRYQLEDGWG